MSDWWFVAKKTCYTLLIFAAVFLVASIVFGGH